MVALSFVGSAILLYSCDKPADEKSAQGDESLMTEYSENLKVVMSQNGRRSYLFETPLVEGYQLAREPYREFRKGIKITTYLDDSMSSVDAVLTANYAIYYENRELWEAKGNVVAEKVADDKTLYTQQLFWNARTHRIYSNVDSKLVQNGGRDVLLGESFESDEEFKDWQLRRSKIRMEVEMKVTETDSTAQADAADPDKREKPSVRPESRNRTVSGRPMGRSNAADNHAEKSRRNVVRHPNNASRVERPVGTTPHNAKQHLPANIRSGERPPQSVSVNGDAPLSLKATDEMKNTK